jgi:cytochrome c biogenesis protein CcmG/thiol:disulfide interchange protein DsbE
MTDTSSSRTPSPPRPRRKRPRWAVYASIPVGVVVAVLIAVLATSKQTKDSADSPLIGKPAPGLTGKLLAVDAGKVGDQPFRLAGLVGQQRWVVVNFFASWCVPCKEEAPELQKWAAEHEATGDAELVQVVFDEDPADSAAFLRDKGGATWPVVASDAGQLALDWGVRKIPETYIVAPNGYVVLKTIAQVTQGWLDQQLAQFKQQAASGGSGG